jgi:uncharacterized protein YggU (UPF0235/DUF167 family)
VAHLRFWVQLTPRAGVDVIDGVLVDGADKPMLRVRVRAAPTDGAANAALLRLLADSLAVPPSSLRLVAGSTGRRKLVGIDGVERTRLERRWPGLLG